MRANRVLGLAAALTLVIAATLAAIVWAQAPAAGSSRGPGFGVRRFMALNYIGRQLNLTAGQKQQIKDIVKAHKDDMKALVDQGFAARKALRQAVAGDNNDEIASAVNQLSAVELKRAQLRAQIRAKIFTTVLQPDQRSKANDLLSRADRRADRRRAQIERFLDGL